MNDVIGSPKKWIAVAAALAAVGGGALFYNAQESDAALAPVECPGGSVDGTCTTVFVYHGRNLTLAELNELRAEGKGQGLLVGKKVTRVVDTEAEMVAAAKEEGLEFSPPPRP